MGAVTNRFSDTFLSDWIAGRLGTSARRWLLVLSADGWRDEGPADGALSAMIGQRIADHGGVLVRQSEGTALAVWGLEQLETADAGRIVAAARALRQTTQALPIVDAQLVDVATAEDPAAAAAAWMAGGVTSSGLRCEAMAPGEIIVTDAFKEMCGPASHLSLIRETAPNGPSQRSLYALTEYQAPLDSDTSALTRQVQLDALGDLKSMIVAAAIIGPEFTLNVLAWLVDIERRRLLPALAAACAHGVLVAERRGAGVHRYRFRDTALHALAYNSVPARYRLRLHCRIAEALRANRTQAYASPPEQVARHHHLADDPVQSRRWLSKAAWRAITNEDAPCATRHLREALANRKSAGDAMSCALLHLLGVQLAITEGNGSKVVHDVQRRATRLARRLPSRTFGHDLRARWLTQSCLLVKGDIRAARRIGKRLLDDLQDDAQTSGGVLGARILVHRMHALSLMLSGRLQQALSHYDITIAHYRAARHGILRFAWGSDQAALAHAHSAWTHALTGNIADVAPSIRRARQACERFDHAHTTAHAMSVTALAALMIGAGDEAYCAAREARAIALENRFPYWTAWNDVMLAAIDAQSSPRTAYATLELAHHRYRATGAAQLSPLVHALLSDAAVRANCAAQALVQADAGLALVAGNGCVVYRPELLHQRARALFALNREADADIALAEGYSAAIETGANLFKFKMEQTWHALGRRRQ